MEFVELKNHLKSRAPKPCYYCYGDDEFIIGRAVALIGELVQNLAEFNVTDKEYQSGNELTEDLMQLPVMSDFRVVIARGKTDIATVEKYLASPNPTTVLVLTKHTPQDAWNKAPTVKIPEGSESVNCNRIGLKYAYGFMRRKAEDAGATISEQAASELYARCGGYMTRINSESQKLAFLRAGGEISVDDIKDNVVADVEYVVYELGDCIIAGNTKRALRIADGMAKSNDLVAAFTMLYNRFKRIFAAAVSPNDLNALGVKPFMQTKLKAEAAKFTAARLKKILNMLSEADNAYKTGAATQYDAMSAFIISAAGSKQK